MADVEIVGPFKDRHVVIDGWRVPLVSACELDGGRFSIVLDHRIGLEVDAQHFDRVMRFIADVIGTCFGYGAHPQADEWYEEAGLENPFADQRAAFAQVPHFTLQPHRVREISKMPPEHECDDNGGTKA